MRLELKGVVKDFGENRVLDNLNYTVKKTSSIVLIGPSGGGKTTLLRLLAGLETPTEGDIKINGKRIDYDEKSLAQYRKRVGMVFQAYNLFPHLNALENITLPLIQVHGLNKKEAVIRAKELLNRFNLYEHSLKRPIALSGGQQQRIAICRAVAVKPDYLLLDEPTSALDPEYTSEVLDIIYEVLEEGMELVLVTHEMGFAREIGGEILFIDEGKILDSGPPDTFFKGYARDRVRIFLDKVLKHHI